MTLVMYDTIDVSTVPPNPPAVAGYVGGRWRTFVPLTQKFPKAHHLSIAVASNEDADCLDIEQGDSTPALAPGWVRRQIARGVHRPVVYASISAMPTVLRALGEAGISRDHVRIWTAHYTFHAHLCSPACGFGFNTIADATQWTDKALGRNLDESLVVDGFFPGAAPPPDPGPRGIPQFVGSFDIQTGRWRIGGTPGWFHPSPKGRTAAARITIDLSTGRWAVRPLPWIVKALTRK